MFNIRKTGCRIESDQYLRCSSNRSVRASITDAINQHKIGDQKWRRKHIQAIEQNYAKAPYVAWFKDGLRGLLDREWLSLVELNVAVTQWMFEALGIHCRCLRASELNVSGTKDDLVINICKAVEATVYLSGHGAKSYQDDYKFRAAGIELRYHNYENPSYSQCNSKAASDLSALDLILNLGRTRERLWLQDTVLPTGWASNDGRTTLDFTFFISAGRSRRECRSGSRRRQLHRPRPKSGRIGGKSIRSDAPQTCILRQFRLSCVGSGGTRP
jgi:hypothetical protein